VTCQGKEGNGRKRYKTFGEVRVDRSDSFVGERKEMRDVSVGLTG